MTGVRVHDARACVLGEGPIWHSWSGALFWFDIMDRKLLCDDGRAWQFPEHVSAGGWVTETRLLIASETSLSVFDVKTGLSDHICDLEKNTTLTRSNDGRADPWGGFWIGTMGKNAEPDAGAIYRFYQGELRQLFAPITISNAICFAPDKSCAYFTDTPTQKIMKVLLDDATGWPNAAPNVFLDLASDDINPDGAIVTTDGRLINAQWGAARLAVYDPSGTMSKTIEMPTDHITCPALGGGFLFATSARQGLTNAQKKEQPDAGKTFAIATDLKPQPEYLVIL
ncbi:SMP-30/gluconolactonase/LRE family protein [Litoreibacter roseus]|uniref:Gluconolactonase n=1 Tax=Litoreibacter roseus TaxID=2601869 RepID=A0A6N6J9M2_9RHOB|nr:SMP-30/gluconolactonase/LRE family protein [Litoreibacter roseus]GFE62951.1 gluconolactonase [Litoreibacter roseus]